MTNEIYVDLTVRARGVNRAKLARFVPTRRLRRWALVWALRSVRIEFTKGGSVIGAYHPHWEVDEDCAITMTYSP